MKRFKTIISTMLCFVFISSNICYADYNEDTNIITTIENTASNNVKKLLGKYYNFTISKGVIAKDPDTISNIPNVTGDNIEIKNINTIGEHIIAITLNGKIDNFDFNDIKLQAYTSDWYSLKPTVKDRITVKDAISTINNDGCTVLLYNINENIEDIRIESSYQDSKFDNLQEAVTIADNYVSWQMSHGGWDKGIELHASRPWNGKESKNAHSGWTAKDGSELGTIDNDATYTHIRHIAAVYAQTGDEKYKKSVENGLEFIFKLQGEKGGLTQVYPKRGNYSDYVTFNDDAMINTLIMLEDIKNKNYPFSGDVISDKYYQRVSTSIDKAVDYILKSQITSQGKLTAWCAQHDPITYEPKEARAFERPSISGSESVSVIKFLMHQEQTPEIASAVESAINWFKNSEVKNTRYDNKDPNGVYFIEDENSSIWYRFYEIGTNRAIFCDRDGIPKYDIKEIGQERREGYSWAGTYPKKLLDIYNQYGYYPDLIQAKVVNTKSKSEDGKTLLKNFTIDISGENLYSGEDISDENDNKDIIYGDVDGNNIISANDAAITQQYVLNNDLPLTAVQILKADVNIDNLIDASDSSTILAKALNNDFTFVAEYGNEVLKLVNQERVKNGLTELKININLNNIAMLKSEDMVINNYFDHISPTYGTPSEMLKNFDISFNYMGENIAAYQRNPQEVVTSWLNSEGHRANILNKDFTQIGIGFKKSASGNGYYWTQIFIG